MTKKELLEQKDKKKKKYFTTIPNCMLESEAVSNSDLILYLHYRKVCGGDEKGSCWESNATLAKKCKLSKNTIIKSRNNLEKLNVIEVFRKKMPNGTDQITITIIDIWEENILMFDGSKEVFPKQTDSSNEVLGVGQTRDLGSSNEVLGVGQTRDTNKNNTNKKRSNKNNPKNKQSGVRPFKGFSLEGDTDDREQTIGEVSSYKLHDGLLHKRKLVRKANLQDWSLEFDRFLQESIITEEEFALVLNWYIDHIGGPFIPKAYSASTFCKKFVSINDAMDRASSKQTNGKQSLADHYDDIKKEFQAEGKYL